MPTGFPASYDNLNNPDSSAGDDLDTPGVEHDEQHANANDAIEAIEHTLGLNPQAGYADVDARISAAEAGVVAADANADSKVDKAGDTMTGPLVLWGDPHLPLIAATKRYVDAKAALEASRQRARYPLLEEAVGWWDTRSGLNDAGELPDASGRGNHMVLLPGSPATGLPDPAPDLTGPAFIEPHPSRGRSLFSPGWNDMFWQTDAPGGIVGIDVAVEVDPTKTIPILFEPATVNWLVHQGSTATGDLAFAFGIDRDTGRLKLVYSEDGTTAVEVESGAQLWESGYIRIAATLDPATGDVKFYTQDFTDPIDEFDAFYSEWTLAETISGSGAVALYDSAAPIRHSCTMDADEADGVPLVGWHASLYRARVRDDVEGADVAYLDTALIPVDLVWDVVTGLPSEGPVDSARVTEFYGREGETWSIWNYMTQSYPIVVMDRPLILFGNGSIGQIGVDNASFDIADNSDFSVWLLFTAERTGDSSGALVAHKGEPPESLGWVIKKADSFPNVVYSLVGDGVDTSGGLPPANVDDSIMNLAGFNLDRSTPIESGGTPDAEYQTITAWCNGEAADPESVAALGSLANPDTVINVGWYTDGSVYPASFGFAALVIFNRKLTPWEIQVALPYELGVTGLQTVTSTPAEPEWTDFSFDNGWAAGPAGATPGWRIKDGELELRGIIDSTSATNPEFASIYDTDAIPPALSVLGTVSTNDLSSFDGAAAMLVPFPGVRVGISGFEGANTYVMLDGLKTPLA